MTTPSLFSPEQYNATLNKYLEQMLASQGMSPNWTPPQNFAAPGEHTQSSGGGGGDLGGAVLGTATKMGAKYALKKLAAQKAAEQAGTQLAGSAAQNAAWNAGADAAALTSPGVATPELLGASRLGGAAATPTTSISNFAGAATPYMGAAGTALGAYQAYKGFKDKDPLSSALGGAGVGMGLNMMGLALGPVGWAAALAVPTIAALANKYGDKDRWKTEGNRLKKLGGIPQSVMDAIPTRGRTRKELIDIAQRTGGNVEFAGSRKEGDLKAVDPVWYAFLPEKFGKDYSDAALDKKLGVTQMLLDNSAIREHHGTMDFNQNLTSDLESKIKSYLSGTSSSPSSQGRSNTSSPGVGKDGKRISYGRGK